MATNNIQELRKRSIIDSLSAPVDITGGFKNIGGREFPRNLESPPLFQQPPIAEQIQTSSPSPVQAPDQPSNDWIRIFENYKPETQASDRFNRLLDEVPQRESPSIARRIVASGQAIKGGAEAAEKTMYAPHARNMADWTAKTGPFQQGATIERQSNANERQTLGQTATAAISQQKADQANKIAEEKNEIAQHRAITYRLRTEMGQGYSMNARGPTVIIQNKTTGEVKDTGIPTGWMSEAEKLEVEGQYRVEAARQTGADARDRAVISGEEVVVGPDGRLYRINPRATEPGGGAKPAQEIPGVRGPVTIPGTPRAGDTTTPTEVGTVRNNKFQEVYDRHPNLRKWMTRPTTTNGDWQLAEPPKMGRWTTRNSVEDQEIKDYNELLGLIDPSAPKIPTRQTTPETSGKAIAPTTVPAAGRGTQSTTRTPLGPPLPDKFKQKTGQGTIPPPGKIKMIDPDGREGWVPMDELKDALAQGYKKAPI